ncbi:hypothetical protein V2W30_36215 [Streptomyces sp. Q6]|uniref:Uncharacterized protein n=1 Tax=Streptomyces citrinus TaxID=3118173 RepID=A0ACD5AM26_9ACTN
MGAEIALAAQQGAQRVLLAASAAAHAQPVAQQVRDRGVGGPAQRLGRVRGEAAPVGRRPDRAEDLAPAADGDDQPLRIVAVGRPVDDVAGGPQGAQQSAAPQLGDAPVGHLAAEDRRAAHRVGVRAGVGVGEDPEPGVLHRDRGLAVPGGLLGEYGEVAAGDVPGGPLPGADEGERGRRAEQFERVGPVRPLRPGQHGDPGLLCRGDDVGGRRLVLRAAHHDRGGAAPGGLAHRARRRAGVGGQARHEHDPPVVRPPRVLVADDQAADGDVLSGRGEHQTQDALVVVREERAEGDVVRGGGVHAVPAVRVVPAIIAPAYEPLPGRAPVSPRCAPPPRRCAALGRTRPPSPR